MGRAYHDHQHGDPREDHLSALLAELWDADVNRFEPPRDFSIDIQDGKSMHQVHDAAHRPLFVQVDKAKFMAVPTFAAFYALLDNYVAETGVLEHVTMDEVREEKRFLQAVVATDVSRRALEFVNAHGWWHGDQREWAEYLHQLWFSLYRRECKNDSSAFEHVFVGEVRDGQVLGFHNWVTIFLAERKKLLDYQGFVWPRRRHSKLPTNDTHLLKLQFMYKGKLKPLCTSIIGASPEFELIAYTLAFLSGASEVPCVLDDTDVKIVVHRSRHNGKVTLGSAYVDIQE